MLTTIHLNIWLVIHLTRLSTEGLGPRHGEVRRAHQMLNAALLFIAFSVEVTPSITVPRSKHQKRLDFEMSERKTRL